MRGYANSVETLEDLCSAIMFLEMAMESDDSVNYPPRGLMTILSLIRETVAVMTQEWKDRPATDAA